MKLNDLRPAAGSHRPPRRLGRGHGSGRGKTAGRGTKGQKSRAGGNLPAWFEGGQTPLHIRTPKLHGFKNRFRVEYAPVNLSALAGAAKGTLITPDVLEHDGLLRDQKLPVKILGAGDAPAGVTVHAHAFSKTAREKLEAAGSTVQRLTWPENAPAEDVEPTAETEHAADASEPAGDARHSDEQSEPAADAEPKDAANAAADGSDEAAPDDGAADDDTQER